VGDTVRGPSGAVNAENFYGIGAALADQLELAQAHGIEGLDHEIAMLRVRLREAIQANPEDLALATRGVNALVRAVVAQYRLSPRAKKELSDAFAALLNGFADQLVPSDR
jgi:hypothetical protein